MGHMGNARYDFRQAFQTGIDQAAIQIRPLSPQMTRVGIILQPQNRPNDMD